MIEIIPMEIAGQIARLLLAGLLGALIGLERDIHGRAAGLRTHLLVSLGAALFMILSGTVASQGYGGGVNADPGRIAAQVVTGIGFLGAGTIIKEGFTIRGLTTAACLWVAAGIGMAAGAGNYAIAVTGTIIAMFTLLVLNRFEKSYRKDSYRTVTITTTSDVDLTRIIDTLKSRNMRIIHFDFEKDYERDTTLVRLSIRLFHRGITDKMSHDILNAFENADIKLKSMRWDHRLC